MKMLIPVLLAAVVAASANAASIRPWTETKAEQRVRVKIVWIDESAVSAAWIELGKARNALASWQRICAEQPTLSRCIWDEYPKDGVPDIFADLEYNVVIAEADVQTARQPHYPSFVFCVGNAPAVHRIYFHSFRCALRFSGGPRWRVYVRPLSAKRFAWRRI